MFSGLQLADGPWFGYDIDQLRRVPDVVLLSACEVGRLTVRWGDELIGMTTAWLHAGARCVIASAAAVNDAAAYDVLVPSTSTRLRGDPAVALAAAVPAVSADVAPVPLVCFRCPPRGDPRLPGQVGSEPAGAGGRRADRPHRGSVSPAPPALLRA